MNSLGIGLAYLVSFALAYGIKLANLQKAHPCKAVDLAVQDEGSALRTGMFGPLGVIQALMSGFRGLLFSPLSAREAHRLCNQG